MPPQDERYAELDDKGRELLENYRQALDAEQRWAEIKRDTCKQLQRHVGEDASRLTVDGRHVCTLTYRETLDVDRLHTERPHDYEDFVVPVPQFDKNRFKDSWPDVYRFYCKRSAPYITWTKTAR